MSSIGLTLPHCPVHGDYTYGCRGCSDALTGDYLRTVDLCVALRQQARGAVSDRDALLDFARSVATGAWNARQTKQEARDVLTAINGWGQ